MHPLFPAPPNHDFRARTGEGVMKLVNRSVLILKPTAKMLDWINSVEEDMVFDLAGDPNNLQAFNLTKKLDRK
jgi:hypothetical protein